MEKMIKVSVIVPVYNMADYLRRCLDSCVNQTLQEIEIIIVNDCSPDPRDGEIMKEYERQFPDKVRCIWHKENMRLGGARNTGIRAAYGEFIYCVDSDDYIDLKLCEKMYNAITAENADMAVCDVKHIEKNIVIEKWKPSGKFDTSDLCERIENIKMCFSWRIMIKKSVIENDNLYFSNHNGMEDAICPLWYLASKKIVRVNESLYYYCIRNDSITQEVKIENAFLVLQTIKYILNLDYFEKLDLLVKKTLLLFLSESIQDFWQVIVCINYSAEFVKFCREYLDLFKLYKFDYNDDMYTQSEDRIRFREIFRFIEENVDTNDFNLKFVAYCQYQNEIMQLRKIRRLLSPYLNKSLTLWGAGAWGKRNARNMSILGIKFEITDANAKIHGEKVLANVVVKSWDEVKNSTNVVLASVQGKFEDIRDKLKEECSNVKVVDLIGLVEQ